jgi:hypothetical protein
MLQAAALAPVVETGVNLRTWGLVSDSIVMVQAFVVVVVVYIPKR